MANKRESVIQEVAPIDQGDVKEIVPEDQGQEITAPVEILNQPQVPGTPIPPAPVASNPGTVGSQPGLTTTESMMNGPSDMVPSVVPMAAYGKVASPPPPVARFNDPMERSVIVRPNATFDTIIGGYRYYFVKDKAMQVPQGVKDILANAAKIYP
jgi:hypothetical protein